MKEKNSKNSEKKEIIIKRKRDLFNNLKERDLKNILKVLNKQGIGLLDKGSERKFNSQKEINDFVVERVTDFLKKKLEDLDKRSSDLEDKGKDVSLVSMKLMSAPLKIKNFKATHEKKDFDKIIEIFEKISEELEKEEPSGKKEKEGKRKRKNKKEEKQEKKIEDAMNSFKEIKKELKRIKGKDK